MAPALQPANAILPPPSPFIGDISIDQVAPSPNYATDNTIFALGVPVVNWCSETCPGLFKSTDKGVTWTRLPATGLNYYFGGKLLIAPGFPTDNRIYVLADYLQVSTDGGLSFIPVAATGGSHASMSPGFSAGDQRILIGGSTRAWVHDAALGTTLPFEKIVVGGPVHAPAFPPDNATTGRVFIGGTTLAPNAPTLRPTIFRCDPGPVCTPVLVMPGTGYTPSVIFSDDFATNGLMYAWSPAFLYKSTDGGSTFSSVALPSPAHRMMDVVLDGDDDIYAAGTVWSGTGVILKSSDDGATWTDIASATTFGDPAQFVRVLSDGRLFTNFRYASSGTGGLQCSVDDGATWTDNGC